MLQMGLNKLIIINDCIGLKNEGTHIVDESGGILGSLEEWSIASILEVASVLLKRGFVQSLLTRNETVIRNMQKK